MHEPFVGEVLSCFIGFETATEYPRPHRNKCWREDSKTAQFSFTTQGLSTASKLLPLGGGAQAGGGAQTGGEDRQESLSWVTSNTTEVRTGGGGEAGKGGGPQLLLK